MLEQWVIDRFRIRSETSPGSVRGHPLSGTWETWMAPNVRLGGDVAEGVGLSQSVIVVRVQPAPSFLPARSESGPRTPTRTGAKSTPEELTGFAANGDATSRCPQIPLACP